MLLDMHNRGAIP